MKQTRGAINLLIASYKGVLKNALIASMATVALSGVANAKTIDLSDDSLFAGSPTYISDNNDGSDTLVTIVDPNYTDLRKTTFINNNQGEMKFDKGGNIYADYINLKDGKFDATDTSIKTRIVTIKIGRAHV